MTVSPPDIGMTKKMRRLPVQNRMMPISARWMDSLRPGKKGFTLVELLIGISILAIVAALSAPPLRQWNANRQLMAQARNLFSGMQRAKLQAIRNNSNVVVNFTLPDTYQIFFDDGGPDGDGIVANQVQDGSETTVASVTMINDISILIADDQFGGTTVCGFTSRGLPLLGRTGNVVFQRNGETHRWYRVALGPSGQATFQASSDSTNGVDGTWN